MVYYGIGWVFSIWAIVFIRWKLVRFQWSDKDRQSHRVVGSNDLRPEVYWENLRERKEMFDRSPEFIYTNYEDQYDQDNFE
jgi:hypothetical protein